MVQAENVAADFVKFLKTKKLTLKYVHEEDYVVTLPGGGTWKKNKKVGPIFYLWRDKKREYDSRHTESDMEHMVRSFMLEAKIAQPSQAYIKNVLKIIRAMIEPHPVVKS